MKLRNQCQRTKRQKEKQSIMEMTDHLAQVSPVIITVAMEIIAGLNIAVKLLMCSFHACHYDTRAADLEN